MANMRPAICAVAVLLGLSACGAEGDDSRTAETSEAAVWELAPDQTVTAAATTFTALVSRLGCNSGRTGDVSAPDIQVTDPQVVVTFAVEPADPGGGDCQGNDWVTYKVTLDEPLGNRPLIDGQCLPGRSAEKTSLCDADGTRWRP
jgi:hypothetical protein